MLDEHSERAVVLSNLTSTRDRIILVSAILVVGLAGTVLDPGRPAAVLLGAAAVALVYVIVRRPFVRAFWWAFGLLAVWLVTTTAMRRLHHAR